MANTRALVKRRKAIRNIRKITRTMELIATARFKKAHGPRRRGRGVHEKIARARRRPQRLGDDLSHPLLVKREPVEEQRCCS